METTICIGGYVIMQEGIVIFGYGATIEEAIEDANEWLDGDDAVSLATLTPSHDAYVGDTVALPASADLIAALILGAADGRNGWAVATDKITIDPDTGRREIRKIAVRATELDAHE